MTGPSDVWYAFGFGDVEMPDTYAIFILVNNSIAEYILGDDEIGIHLPSSINHFYIYENQSKLRTAHFTKSLMINEFPFILTNNLSIDIIWAYGRLNDPVYYGHMDTSRGSVTGALQFKQINVENTFTNNSSINESTEITSTDELNTTKIEYSFTSTVELNTNEIETSITSTAELNTSEIETSITSTAEVNNTEMKTSDYYFDTKSKEKQANGSSSSSTQMKTIELTAVVLGSISLLLIVFMIVLIVEYHYFKKLIPSFIPVKELSADIDEDSLFEDDDIVI